MTSRFAKARGRNAGPFTRRSQILRSDAGKAKEIRRQAEVGAFLAEPKQVETGNWHEMEKEPPGKERLGRDAENSAANTCPVRTSAARLSLDRSLWTATVDRSGNHIGPIWEKVASAEFAVNRFTVTSLQGSCQIVAATTSGGVRAATYRPGSPTTWLPIDWESAVDWTPGMSWSEIAPGGKGIEARTDGEIAAVSHVSGPVEIFAQRVDNSLAKSWWS